MPTSSTPGLPPLTLPEQPTKPLKKSYRRTSTRHKLVVKRFRMRLTPRLTLLLKSRVVDTDYANETASLTKTQILQQAATAMLSQANASPNVVLALLK
ncbi:MAG: hypothetical protein EBV34_12530 [Betaproteobacteria bacterium]|nr:hypothetical protein [Betaproteobacteria bacterium]